VTDADCDWESKDEPFAACHPMIRAIFEAEHAGNV